MGGFAVYIEVDGGGERLLNYPGPDLGDAVLSFLMGLMNYSRWNPDKDDLASWDQSVLQWFQSFEQSAGLSLFPACRALCDCVWSDGGDNFPYRQGDYEVFQRRMENSGLQISEAKFNAMVQDSERRWQPIRQVIEGARLLVNAFKTPLEPLPGVFEPEWTIPDFEALLSNLEFFAHREAKMVRLNFA